MKPQRIKYINWLPLCMVVLLHVNIYPATGQSYVLTKYNSKTGISHDFVRQIVADSSGFIWMATWDGLTRYDGTDFVNYSYPPLPARVRQQIASKLGRKMEEERDRSR